MSVMKEDGTKRLIDQILASLKVGKYAIMDKVLNINSSNPVENKVITQAINGINTQIDDIEKFKLITLSHDVSIAPQNGGYFEFQYDVSEYSGYALVETAFSTGSGWYIGQFASDVNGDIGQEGRVFPRAKDVSTDDDLMRMAVWMLNDTSEIETYTLRIKVLLLK